MSHLASFVLLMVKTFLKYFLSVYLLLLSGITVLYGDTAQEGRFGEQELVDNIFKSNHDLLIHPPCQNNQWGKRLFEVTEVEDSEDEKKTLKRSVEIKNYLTAFLRDQLLKSFFFENTEKRAPLHQYFPSSQTPKRHIILEVFLI